MHCNWVVFKITLTRSPVSAPRFCYPVLCLTPPAPPSMSDSRAYKYFTLLKFRAVRTLITYSEPNTQYACLFEILFSMPFVLDSEFYLFPFWFVWIPDYLILISDLVFWLSFLPALSAPLHSDHLFFFLLLPVYLTILLILVFCHVGFSDHLGPVVKNWFGFWEVQNQ